MTQFQSHARYYQDEHSDQVSWKIPFGTKVIIRNQKLTPPDQPPARRQTQSNNQNFFQNIWLIRSCAYKTSVPKWENVIMQSTKDLINQMPENKARHIWLVNIWPIRFVLTCPLAFDQSDMYWLVLGHLVGQLIAECKYLTNLVLETKLIHMG